MLASCSLGDGDLVVIPGVLTIRVAGDSIPLVAPGGMVGCAVEAKTELLSSPSAIFYILSPSLPWIDRQLQN